MSLKLNDTRKNFLINFLIIFGLIISYIFKLGIASLGLFIVYIGLLLFRNTEIVLKYFYIFFLIIINICGVFIIEYSTTQIYLYEIAQFSYKAYSLPALILIYVIFIETLKILEIKYGSKIIKSTRVYSKKNFDYAVVFFILLLGIMFLNVINKPFFIYSYDRFDYQKFILSNIEAKLGNMMLWVSPIFFVGYKKNKRISLFGIILFFLYFLWIGNKFSVFLISFQLGVLVLIRYINYSKLKKFMSKIVQLFLGLMVVVLIQSSIVNNRDFEENIFYFKSRLAQQGQLWWGIYKEPESHFFHLEEAELETKVFFTLNDDASEKKKYLGMFKAMRLVAPDYMVNRKIEQGSRYAASTQGLLFYYFNLEITAIFMFLIAFLLVFASNLLIRYAKEYNFICFILTSKILVALIRMFSNSDFDSIFSIENVLSIFILIIFGLIKPKESSVHF